MKRTKRLIALALAGVLMLGGLTACGKMEASLPEYDPETLDTTTITDLTEFLLGVPGDTAVATLNGEDVTADELVYWLVANCDSLQQNAYYYTGSTDIPWDASMGEGVTVQDYVRAESLNLALSQRMVAQKAFDEGVDATAEQMQEVSTLLESIKAEGETRLGATLDEYLELSMALDANLFTFNWRCDYMYEAMRDARFAGDNVPTDEDVLTWLEEDQGFYKVKHILLSTRDEAQNPLPDEQVAEKRAVADDLLAQLLAAEDPIALFDELMTEYGEDPGVASSPDGYTAQPGQMVAEFEQASLGLEEGSFSDVVTSEFGYHIILRLPLDMDPAEYRDAYINSAMGQLVGGWLEQSEVKTEALCDEVDVKDLFERMTAFRNRFGQPPVEQADPAEGDSSTAE